MRKAWLCTVVAFILAACGPLPSPVRRFTPPTQPTATRPARSPRPTRTPTPTETLPPLPTDTPQPPPTPTLLPITLPPSPIPSPAGPVASPTSTRPPPGEFDCKLKWQSPGRYAVYDPGEKFGAGWNVQNIGTATWDPASFRFVYLGGYKLSRNDQVSVPTTVPAGGTAIFSVPMKAPYAPGTYTTHWGLRSGDNFFCKLTVTIVVQ